MRRIHVSLLLVLLLVPTAAYPQTTTGSIEGTVLAPGGGPASGVRVVATGPALQGEREGLTTADGFFRILDLPVGLYTLKVDDPAQGGIEMAGWPVRLGRTTDVGRIELRGGATLIEVMTVVGGPALLDPSSAMSGANLRADEFADLPVERNYQTLAQMLPHANESFYGDGMNITGGTGLETKYFIDGVDVTDPNLGIGGTDLPYNFIREVNVRTGGYEAEYRSSLGGIVEVVTNSGSNEFSGQAFGFFSGSELTEEPDPNDPAASSGDYMDYDFGFGVGGPVVKDKLWYYASLNPVFRDEDLSLPSLGKFVDTQRTQRFATKLDWRPGERHDVTLSVFGDPTTGDWVMPFGLGPADQAESADPFLYDLKRGGINGVLESRHWLGERSMIRVTAAMTHDQFQLDQTSRENYGEYLYIDTTPEEGDRLSGGAPYRIDKQGRTAGGGLHGTHETDRHLWKAGLEYQEIRSELGHEWFRAIIALPDDPDTPENDPSWLRSTIEVQGEGIVRVPSAYVQDSWRATDRLRLNLGLRWDGQTLRQDGRTVIEILDQWQPRAGFTYATDEDGDSQVFGSIGRFYQEISANVPVNVGLSRDVTEWYDHDPRSDPSGGIPIAEYYQEYSGDDLEGQHYDEFTFGYERRVGSSAKFGVRGIYRTLRRGIEDAVTEDGRMVVGNVGYGELSNWPRMQRDYAALELNWQMRGSRFAGRASYVLSQLYGNYAGLAEQTTGQTFPNLTWAYRELEAMPNSTGLLPGNRTHVLKLSGSLRARRDLTLGAFFTVQSGTPLTRLGITPGQYPMYEEKRGADGTTPAIWSLDLRVAYTLGDLFGENVSPRLILDVLDVGNPRRPVRYDQQVESPTYQVATQYQPPTSVRLGMELDF